MTPEQIERHEEAGESMHIPAIMHRTGGPDANELNTCGICGAYIAPSQMNHTLWLEITEAQADAIRTRSRKRLK